MPIPRTKQPSRKVAIAAPAFDWLPLWAMSLGFAAVMIATIAYFAAADQTGAAFVLLGAAGLIALVLRASAPCGWVSQNASAVGVGKASPCAAIVAAIR